MSDSKPSESSEGKGKEKEVDIPFDTNAEADILGKMLNWGENEESSISSIPPPPPKALKRERATRGTLTPSRGDEDKDALIAEIRALALHKGILVEGKSRLQRWGIKRLHEELARVQFAPDKNAERFAVDAESEGHSTQSKPLSKRQKLYGKLAFQSQRKIYGVLSTRFEIPLEETLEEFQDPLIEAYSELIKDYFPSVETAFDPLTHAVLMNGIVLMSCLGKKTIGEESSDEGRSSREVAFEE